MNKYGLILVIFAVTINTINGNNLCTTCKCGKQFLESKVNINITVIKCDGHKKKNLDTAIDLTELTWPNNNQNMKYFARFNNLNKYYLPQISGSPDVIGLDLRNNSIRNVHSNPFLNFPNLEEITLSDNKLFGVEEWFESTKKLKYLSLSNTSISELQPHCVSHLEYLYELDLSYNSITKLSSEFFKAIRNVENLHVHHNKVNFIESLDKNLNNNEKSSQLKYLDLSYNKLTVIITQFDNLIHLQTLILRGNLITYVDSNSFSKLNRIQSIDLSFNILTEIGGFTNASGIKVLNLNDNKIKIWNIENIPENLTELYVQSNDLKSFAGDNFDQLKIFNLSRNSLDALPNIKFANLEILDLSYNTLTAVPQGMAERTPVLDTLILDHNPIPTIRFADRIKLRRLTLNHMPLIKSIDYETFKNIEETGAHSSGNITCLELEMSNCPYLSEIDPNALEHVNLCKLDLSYNKFSSLPENLTDWSAIEKGINLQGNPFDCECSAKWMLDRIVEQLYKNKTHQYLLRELRCNQPKLFANKRFVKFYRRGDIFCHAESAEMLAQLRTFEDDDRVDIAGFNIKIDLRQGPSYITIILSCILLLLVMIGFGIYWTRQQRKALGYNRRFT